MFDVFYTGPKPGLFPFELPADTLAEAASLSRTKFFWFVDGQNDYTRFDFNFRAVPWEEHQIHTWPNQWQVDGGTYFANKYTIQDRIHNFHTETYTHRLPNLDYWHIPNNVDLDSVDYRWCPDTKEPPYIYVFGNQWNSAVLEPTAIYSILGATEYKYMEEMPVRVLSMMDQWTLLDDILDFDYSWRPNPKEPPYIYIFGNQWLTPEQRPALKYTVLGATEIKYMEYPKANRVSKPELFITHYACEFDYSWEPDPGSPPYNYIFGNQHWPAEIMPTVEYHMAGATEDKFMDEPRAQLTATSENWQTLINCEFDYSWCPDPGDPPYIYVFGNQWYAGTEMPTVEYHVFGATERKFLDEPRARLFPIMERWTVPEEVDATNIDFSWVPHPKDAPYIHHFGSEFQMSVGLLYTVPSATEPKFEGEIPLIKIEKKQLQVLDIFFIDKSNVSSAARYEKLVEQYPHAQRVRYVNSMIDTIRRCIARAKSGKFWVISSENVYDNFNFAWHAQPWQSYMTHVFGSQHQKWSDTYLINRWEFERTVTWANSLEEFPNLNFVQDQSIIIPDDLHDIYYVDHNNHDNGGLNSIQTRFNKVKVTRYVSDYLNTFKRIMSTATTEYVWIISSLCDYSRFDFSWQPEPWQREMIHVFPSADQPRGDTFYIHVESFKKQMDKLELLDWFDVINYCEEQRVPRLPIPCITYKGDNLVDVIKQHEFEHPYTWFVPYFSDILYNPSIWSLKDKKIMSFSPNNGYILAPREAKNYINTQVYDYPYISKNSKISSLNQDIIFISYDEPNADANWQILSSKYPQARRLHGVEGIEIAKLKAAEMSSTDWYYAVFAKTELHPDFDFSFSPDLFQEPKHYIFHAENPLNGLCYGHMGVVLYNCGVVKATTKFGIDYTMSAPHAVIPITSAIARFNSDPYQTWRTAFREASKLAQFCDETDNVENSYRLNIWTSKAEGPYSEWCLQGARDGVMFYHANKEDKTQLKNAFNWVWLREYFSSLYKDTNEPDLNDLLQRQQLWQQQ